MSQIKKYICAIIMLMTLGVISQNSVNIDLEGNIANYISQAQLDVDSYNYFEAQNKLEEALAIAKNNNNKKDIGLVHSKLGQLYYIIEEPKKALEHLIKAKDIQRIAKDNFNIIETYNSLGKVYMFTNEYELALDYFKSTKTLFEQEGLDTYVTEVLLNQGKSYIALKAHNTAKIILEETITKANQQDLNKIHSSALINIAKAYSHLEENEKALALGNEGLSIAKNNQFDNILNEGYFVLSEINQKVGNYNISIDYLKKYITLTNKLLEIKKENLSPEKQLQFLKDNQTEYQLESQEDFKELQDKNSLNKLTTILSVALITILSLLTLSLYKNNNIRLKTNNMLHKKNGELTIAKEKAELASKTKANFLSTVTHELRTPLYAVTGLTNMLLDENPKAGQIKHLKSLKFSGDYLLTFINDILQINKIEANKVEIEPEVFDLKKKVKNVTAALNNSALDNNIKIHLEYDKELPHNFKADQLKISQILINLIGNSIKFTKDGDIWIRVNKIDQKGKKYNVRFEVEDNGIGISKEKQENMFESFSQGSIQINRKYGGTGLGLSIVKGLIELLHGKIYLKSELGKGTSFFFEIPMEYSEEVIKEKKPVTYFNDDNEIDLDKIKILVVEDNKINQMITKKILNKMKLYCDLVDNGEEAVDLVKTNNYDVVLMDIHMPGISGLEATKIIRTFDKELTIFALTAVTLEDKMHEFDEAGFDDIISKPFKQEDFEKKLYDALKTQSKSNAS